MVNVSKCIRILSRYRDVIPDFDFFINVVLSRPIRCIRVNFFKVDPKELHNILTTLNFNLYPVKWLNYAFYSMNKGLGRTLYHGLGYYYVEDLVSLLPPIILFKSLRRKLKILDLAAAPGGKCTHMSQLLLRENLNSLVIANEPDNVRRRALIINVERLTLPNIIITGYDGRYFPKTTLFDGIIFDAPCSSESLLYEMSARDLKMLSESTYIKYSQLQKSIIRNAYEIIDHGGLLVYSVCTFAPEEAEDVINYALEVGFKVEKLPRLPFKFSKGLDEWKISGKVIRFDSSISKHTVRLYPHLNYDDYQGSIGYLYLSLLRKV